MWSLSTVPSLRLLPSFSSSSLLSWEQRCGEPNLPLCGNIGFTCLRHQLLGISVCTCVGVYVCVCALCIQ